MLSNSSADMRMPFLLKESVVSLSYCAYHLSTRIYAYEQGNLFHQFWYIHYIHTGASLFNNVHKTNVTYKNTDKKGDVCSISYKYSSFNSTYVVNACI